MIIRSLELANFRKFRDPLRIDGFTDGLNVVVDTQRDRAAKLDLLEQARAGAKAFDLDGIKRRLENMDRAATRRRRALGSDRPHSLA